MQLVLGNYLNQNLGAKVWLGAANDLIIYINNHSLALHILMQEQLTHEGFKVALTVSKPCATQWASHVIVIK